MVSASGIVVGPLIIANLICASEIGEVRVHLVSTMLVVCGLATILQVTVGVRSFIFCFALPYVRLCF